MTSVTTITTAQNSHKKSFKAVLFALAMTSVIGNLPALADTTMSEALFANLSAEKQATLGTDYLKRFNKRGKDLDRYIGIRYLERAAELGSDKAKALLNLINNR